MESYEVAGILITALVAYGVWSFFHMLTYWKKQSVPGPRPLPLIGNVLLYASKPVSDVETELIEKYGPLVGLMEGTTPVLLVADATMADEVFVKNFSNFTENISFFHHSILSQGVISLDGPQWRTMRKTLGPAFTMVKMKGMVAHVESCLSALGQHLDSRIRDSKDGGGNDGIHVTQLMERLVLDVVGRVFFGSVVDIYDDSNDFVQHMRVPFEEIGYKVLAALVVPGRVLRQFDFTIFNEPPLRYMMALLRHTIRQRKQAATGAKNGKPQQLNDFIDVLLEARDKDGNSLTDDQILANMMQLTMGGNLTLPAAIVPALYHLALDQDMQQRVRQEVTSPDFVDTDGKRQDSLVNAVTQETVRLYPHGVRIDRYARNDVTLTLGSQQVHVKAGTKARLPIYYMSRDPKVHQDPHSFHPDRYMPGGSSAGAPVYGFAHGPRNCLGEPFARLMIRMTMAFLFRNYKITKCSRTTELDFSKSTMFLVTPLVHLKFEKLNHAL